MTATTATYSDEVVCVPRAGTLYDVLELILDRGMVIDVFIRVSLVGIEILKIDARIVVASVDTYLRFAEACNRLDLESDTRSRTVPELFSGGGGGVPALAGRAGAKKAAQKVGDKVKEVVGAGGEDNGDHEDEDEHEYEESAPASRSRQSGSRSSSAGAGPGSRKRSTPTSRTRKK